ncbi:MAG: hypothetical protein GY866_11305 [Proteobacteria bacterium]|nr:hypothetical protein [Pseudomonadota bacterium]
MARLIQSALESVPDRVRLGYPLPDTLRAAALKPSFPVTNHFLIEAENVSVFGKIINLE